MIREAGIDVPKMPKSDFDDPFGTATGSGVIFGATGGVMEAALRTVSEIVTGPEDREVFRARRHHPARAASKASATPRCPSPGGPVPETAQASASRLGLGSKARRSEVAVCHGTANAKKVMEDIKAGGKFSQCHFIEFMACPGGCLGGGASPIPTSPAIRAARAKAIYAEGQR